MTLRLRSLSFCLALVGVSTLACCGTAADAPQDAAQTDACLSCDQVETLAGTDLMKDLPPWTGDPCDFQGVSDLAPAALRSGGFVVGDFVVLASADTLKVTTTADPSNELFSARISDGLRLADARLETTDVQGSFQVAESVDSICSGASLAQAQFDSGRLILSGTFDGEKCKGTPFTWSFCEPQAGQIRFQLQPEAGLYKALYLTLAAKTDEGFYGMGEQFPQGPLDLRGQVIPVLVQEGGIGRGDPKVTPVMETLSPGSGGSPERTYFPMPQFTSTHGRGLLLENSEVSFFDFTGESDFQIRLYAPSMIGRIYAGNPLELIESTSAFAGRMPPLPDWVQEGAIVALARTVEESIEHLDALLQAGVKVSAVWNQTWCGKNKTLLGEQVLWNWAYNDLYHPQWPQYLEWLDARNIRLLCYINPMFARLAPEVQVTRRLFDEGLAQGFFVKNPEGEPLIQKVTAYDVAMIDLSHEGAREWMKNIIKDELITKSGCDGWMADFGEALPFDAVMASGETGETWHNRYPVEWAKLNREVLDELGLVGSALVFHRSGYTGSAQHAIAFWQGDQVTSWDPYDGLRSALNGLLNGGFSGIAINHSDVGGYTTVPMVGPGYTRTLELLQRWTEMNTFGPILRTHEGNSPSSNVQVYSDPLATAHFARFSELFQALAEYRKQVVQEAATKGWPVVRHLAMLYPNDAKAWATGDQFLFGSQILVAPVLEPCGQPPCLRTVYLPQGEWKHAWSDQTWSVTAQGLTVQVEAPVGSPAVFHKVGFAWPIVEAWSPR